MSPELRGRDASCGSLVLTFEGRPEDTGKLQRYFERNKAGVTNPVAPRIQGTQEENKRKGKGKGKGRKKGYYAEEGIESDDSDDSSGVRGKSGGKGKGKGKDSKALGRIGPQAA